MTEPAPNEYGFRIFPNAKAVDDWIDAARAEGGPAPLFVALIDDTMVPKPRGWESVKKDQALQLRRMVDEAMAKARGKDGPEFAGMRRFGYVDERGELVGGAVMWQSGAMTWPDETKQPTEAQQRRWASRNGEAVRSPQQQLYDSLPADHPSLHPPYPPASTIVSPPFGVERARPAATPGFETYEMKGERLIVAAAGVEPVMLVLREGKITLKKLA